jgi:hypothetical protein
MARSRLFLPSELKLTCTSCRESFSVRLRSLDGRLIVRCPFCTAKIEVYGAVSPEIRRVLYRAAREKLEEMVMLELGNEVEFIK